MAVSLRDRAGRRQTMRLLVGTAIGSVLAGGLPKLACAQDARFAPPPGPMRFTRTLARSLPDGAQIVVTRSWQVAFQPVPSGFVLDGRQLSVHVAVPPALAALAQMEEQRDGSEFLPLALDVNGLIGDLTHAPDDAMVNQAIANSEERLRIARLAQDAAAQARQFMAALQHSASQMSSQLPRDLFAPRRAQWQEERDVVLSPSSSGRISVSFSARMDAAGRVMEHAERRIVTTIEERSKSSSESWELVPL